MAGLIGLIAELVVLASVVAGIISNAVLIGSCDLLNLKLQPNTGIGPWRADIQGAGCVGWDKDTATEADTLINMARATTMMALIFGLILAFFGFFKQCLCPLPCSQLLMDISGTGVQISLALVWPVWRSSVCKQYGCSWGSGATALLCAHIFYLAASIFTRCMREPRYERNKEREEEG